jgi:hypothetical protein
LILREIVGLVAEVLAKMSDFSSRLILDDDAVPSGTRVAPRTTIAVRDEVVLGRMLAGRIFARRKKRFRRGPAGIRHAIEFTTTASMRSATGGEACG